MIKRLLLLLTLPVCASAGTLPEQLAVPGGIVHVPVGDYKTPMPQVFYQNHRVLVLQHDLKWLALVGIPLDAVVGSQNVTVKTAKGDTAISFQIRDKKYPAQYLKLKNKRMVNPNPDDEKRISDDQSKPLSILILLRRLMVVLAAYLGSNVFLISSRKIHMAVWILRLLRVHRLKRLLVPVLLIPVIFITMATRCFSIMAKASFPVIFT
jgi:Peptidase family M23 N-terminal domain